MELLFGIVDWIVNAKEYLIHLAILVGIYAILAQGLNIPFGMGHLFNLAHVGVYAVGAYTTALLSTTFGMGFFPCIVSSMLFSGLLALVIGGISLKLTRDYFAIGTLAFAMVINALLINWKSLTRGVLGIPGIPRPAIGQIDFYQNINFLYLTLIIMAVVMFVVYFFFHNSFARGLRAQAEHEHATLALGRNTRLIRNFSFFIGSCCAGVAGSLFAYYINYIDPSSFALHEMIFVLTIVVVAKPGSFWGCIFATVFLVLLPEPLRFIEISPSILGPMRQLIYSVVLFLVVYINRSKLFPLVRTV